MLHDMEPPPAPAGRHVDPVFQHSRCHHGSFIRDLAKAGSVGFVETAVEDVGLLFVAQKSGAQVRHRCACEQPTFFEPSVCTVALPCRISASA